jgi:hypothetical protein
MRPGRLPLAPDADTYPVSMPKLPTFPARRASFRASSRRLLHLVALTAVALPLVAFAPAGADVDADVATVAAPPLATALVPRVVPPVVPPADAPWDVTVRDGDIEVRGVTTARTVDEALNGLGIARGPFDRVEPDLTRVVRGSTTLRLVRVALDEERHEIELQEMVVTFPDPDLPRGTVAVVREGEPGLAVETTLVLHVNGEVEARLTVDHTVVREPIGRIQRIGTREVRTGSVWDALARCESRGRWDAVRYVNAELSYYGGLQFAPRTWNAFRPANFPAVASEATREQQILVAERVLAAQGWGAWPSCSRRLGLR